MHLPFATTQSLRHFRAIDFWIARPNKPEGFMTSLKKHLQCAPGGRFVRFKDLTTSLVKSRDSPPMPEPQFEIQIHIIMCVCWPCNVESVRRAMPATRGPASISIARAQRVTIFIKTMAVSFMWPENITIPRRGICNNARPAVVVVAVARRRGQRLVYADVWNLVIATLFGYQIGGKFGWVVYGCKYDGWHVRFGSVRFFASFNFDLWQCWLNGKVVRFAPDVFSIYDSVN